jgi:metal-dependent amidase/aminoacylase/carboxypeptidase family protein
MSDHGFIVQKHYLGMETAWRADFQHRSSSHDMLTPVRTLGLNSEMDALPGIGHACGHNLIAIAGVAVALAAKTVLEKHDISGNIVLLGTPGASSSAWTRCLAISTLNSS